MPPHWIYLHDTVTFAATTDPSAYRGDGMAVTDPADLGFRCSPWTRARGVDPIGSAGTVDELLLVEWPMPWPRDVSDIPALAAVALDPRARLMLVTPLADDGESDGLARVVHHRRTGTHRLPGVDHRVTRGAVPALLTELLDQPERDQLDWPSAVAAAPPEVLVCGHGRRDPCCGRWGTLLHAELAARGSAARVWRCSHTGGHRFAPTAITLPDGRAWAYADADLLEGVLARTVEVSTLDRHDRGCLALPPWAQVVERAVFQAIGWDWLQHDVTETRVEEAADGSSAAVELVWRDPGGATGRASATVGVARVLPVLVCGEPPDATTKSSPEYVLLALTITR